MAARELGDLLGEPGVELGHQRRAEFLTGGKPLGRALGVDAALDVEQGVKTLHDLERDRIEVLPGRAPPLPANYLYYPSRRQPTAAFRAFLEVMRD